MIKRVNKYLLLILMSAIAGKVLSQTPRPLPANYTASTPVNFIRTWDATAPETDANVLPNRFLRDVKMSTQYFDGLGRPIQTVVRMGSVESTGGAAADMVAPVEYDQYGREVHKYLPFVANSAGGNASINDGKFKLNPFEQQASFMTAQYGPQGETFFYSKTNIEPSPLNRTEKAMAPGNSWVGAERGVSVKNWMNTTTDDVKIWTVNPANPWEFGTYSVTGVYGQGQLYKNVTVDEKENQIIEFIDKEGKIILKKVQMTATPDDGNGKDYTGWMCTYYIYDEQDNLRCVIQPEGVKQLTVSSWQWTLNLLAEQCFRYEYDSRSRMITKKVPGAGEVWMVYDAKDRLVMTQDANMRFPSSGGPGKWMYTTYDEFNRPLSTGLITDPVNYNNHLYHLNAAAVNNSYPVIANYTSEELTRTFYNDYNWLSSYGNPLPVVYNSSFNTYFQPVSNTVWPYAQANVQTTNLKGLLTGSRVKILGTSTYLYTVNIYDEKGRAIQVQSTNITGGIDIVTTQYTWTGQPLVIVQKQEKYGPNTNGQTSVLVTQLSYDDLGRMVKTEKKASSTLVNGGAMPAYKTITETQYDKLGQVKKKNLAPSYGATGLETLNYDYNIRGWMLGMNRNYLTTTGQSGTTRFGFELGYDKLINSGGRNYTASQFNGNISGMIWKSDGDDVKRKYDFSYDAANRLLKGLFEQDDAVNSWNRTTMDYSMQMGDGTNPLSAYDANGNIKGMTQYGWKLGASVTTPIDNMRYTYYEGTNRLKSVTDFNNDALTKLGDFRTASTHPQYGTKGGLTSSSTPAQFEAITDYSYDVNGNLVTDNNKAISSIIYNHLNLPSVITVMGKGTITYTYDAAGSKIQKTTVDNTVTPAKTTTTLYLGGAVYENDVLQFLGHEEGRIRFKAAEGTSPASLQYDYMIKDHLGNVRMLLTEEQQQDKYPVASLEPSKIATEKNYYDIKDAQLADKTEANGIPDYNNDNGIGNNPADAAFSASNSTKLYKLNSNTAKMGMGITLKVMAGDKIDVFGKSYYFQNNPGPGSNSAIPVADLLAAFLGAPGAGASTSGHGTATVATINNATSIAGINSMMTQQNNQSNSASTKPRAFINVLFFDEQFKAVDYRISMVGNNSELKNHYTDLQNIVSQKNGYVYIYVSNESPVNVFFDNLQVVHTRGAILEETHYYPFGLTMNGISSKSLNNSPENKFRFNTGTEFSNGEFSDGSGLEVYETPFRGYDCQLGRFNEIDPLSEITTDWSVYAFCGNNPVLYSDPLGLCRDDTLKKPADYPNKDNHFVPLYNIVDNPPIVPGWSSNKPKSGNFQSSFGTSIAAGAFFRTTGTAILGSNPEITGPLLAGGMIVGLAVVTIYGANTYANPALPSYWSMPRDNTRRTPKPISLPKPVAVPIDYPLPKGGKLPPINIALSVSEYLKEFASFTGSVPYYNWGGVMPIETTAAAYSAAIIALGRLPNVHFNFNLSTPTGLVNDPINLSTRSNAITTAEFLTVFTLFREKTTFWIKSGTIYKPFTIK